MSGGTNRRRRPGKGRPTQGRPNREAAGAGPEFWGQSGQERPAGGTIRPTPDPGALVRSLGDPPLGPTPAAAAHHLAVIYEEAVRAATALAAANGLLDIEPEDQAGR